MADHPVPVRITGRDSVRLLTLNRPQVSNALDQALLSCVREALNDAIGDSRVRALVFTGAPTAFCSGMDLAAIASNADPLRHAHRLAALLDDVLGTIEASPKPIVASVNGAAVAGGAALAICCDATVMAASACIGYPAIRHGITAPLVLPSLIRSAGWRRARYLLLTGELVGAERACDWSLVDECVEDNACLERAVALAHTFAEIPQEAYARTKRLLQAEWRHDPANADSHATRRTLVHFADDSIQRIRRYLRPK